MTELKLQIFSITGRKLVEQIEKTNYLEFEATASDGNSLANGVYLYRVTVRGLDGTILQSQIKKLVVIR